jgi:hypothetical protein
MQNELGIFDDERGAVFLALPLSQSLISSLLSSSSSKLKFAIEPNKGLLKLILAYDSLGSQFGHGLVGTFEVIYTLVLD